METAVTHPLFIEAPVWATPYNMAPEHRQLIINQLSLLPSADRRRFPGMPCLKWHIAGAGDEVPSIAEYSCRGASAAPGMFILFKPDWQRPTVDDGRGRPILCYWQGHFAEELAQFGTPDEERSWKFVPSNHLAGCLLHR
jgi:hypothetical protein